MQKNQSPWASGPGEILRHALYLLRRDSDTNRRLAMISIDNAVELMIKTYLGLPKRVTGISLSRQKFQEISESFPKLLDALEEHATDKLDGINLGEIEWYHRLRNELYHQGNGLTVERDKVDVYAELANILFNNLFGFRLVQPDQESNELLGDFMAAWVALERALMNQAAPLHEDTRSRPMLALDAARLLFQEGLLSREELAEIDRHRMIRNRVVHGEKTHKLLSLEIVDRLKSLARELESRSAKSDNPSPTAI